MQRPTRGQALVEFALIAVLLLLLMAGTVDVARLVTAYTYLNNAAQEGAVYGAMRPTDVTGITQRVRDTARSLFPPDQVTVNVSYITQPCPGNRIQVEVQSQLVLIFPLAELFSADRRVTLTTSAQQVILQSNAAGCP